MTNICSDCLSNEKMGNIPPCKVCGLMVCKHIIKRHMKKHGSKENTK